MIKEYYNFIKSYIKVSRLNKLYLILTITTAILYKIALVLMTLFASWIIKYATEGNFDMVYKSIFYLAIDYVVYNIMIITNHRLYGLNMRYSYTKLQSAVLEKLMTIDDNFTNEVSKGKLMNSINQDVIDIGDMVDQISELFATIVQIVIILVIVFNCSLLISLIMLAFVYVYIKVRNWADNKSSKYQKKEEQSMDDYSNLFAQIITGLQDIKTFDMFPKLKGMIGNIQKNFTNNFMKKRKYIVIRSNDTRFIVRIFRLLIYIIVISLIQQGKFGVDILILIIGYHENLFAYLDELFSSTEKIRLVNISVERVNSILNYEVVQDIKFGINEKDDIEGVVEFKNVSFGYREDKILNNISFKVKPNNITAIVGKSGSGKTSIINLLLRLYKVSNGEIFIFNMSIRKNLDFVDTNIYNQIEACKKVGIHDFIMTLPNGYNTVLKENATNISGGQKQLISLARTLLSKSEVLLFDEVTSSLDPDTAKHIANLLQELKKSHTVIMITHKPELMKKTDRIIVLSKGKIVGDGKHKDLIKDNEHYKWLQTRKSSIVSEAIYK